MVTEYCFLLGAGASAPAGIPTMGQLYDLYLENLTEKKLNFIEQLEQNLDSKWKKGRELNLESLLRTLNLINKVNRKPIKSFFTDFRESINQNLDLVAPMIKELKGLIRKKCSMVYEEDIEYLLPLLKFIHETDSLQIFTLNYDLTIEILCELYRINYTDGFNLHWKPKLLQNKEHDLRLYKLHGSVIWYQTENGKKLKLPIIDYKGELKYFLGNELSNMLVYPEQNKPEPFKKLLEFFDEELLQKKLLISIGYSFCDPLIRQKVLAGLKDNPELHIYLVSPHAQELLENYFSDYHERIVVFNQAIEDALQEDFLYSKLKNIL